MCCFTVWVVIEAKPYLCISTRVLLPVKGGIDVRVGEVERGVDEAADGLGTAIGADGTTTGWLTGNKTAACLASKLSLKATGTCSCLSNCTALEWLIS